MSSKEMKSLIRSINKKYGDNTLVSGKEFLTCNSYNISTGVLAIDRVLNGGIPNGRMTTIAGLESSFKSLIGYKTIAKAQQMRKKIVNEKEVICDKGEEGDRLEILLIQTEHGSLTEEWAERQGIDLEHVMILPAKSAEEAFRIALAFQKAGGDLIVFDTLNSLQSEYILEKEVGDSRQMASLPKLISEYLSIYTLTNNKLQREGKFPTTLLALAQLRDTFDMYNPLKITGGRGITYYEHIELRFSAKGKVEDASSKDTKKVGKVLGFRVNKSKVTGVKPFTVGEVTILTADSPLGKAGEVDNLKTVLDLCVKFNIITRAGAFYDYDGLKFQGMPKLQAYIKENALANQLYERVLEAENQVKQLLDNNK